MVVLSAQGVSHKWATFKSKLRSVAQLALYRPPGIPFQNVCFSASGFVKIRFKVRFIYKSV